MVPDRKLTPREKQVIRDYQTREILRRRSGSPEGAAEAEAEVDAEVAARLAAGGAKCPDCGTPYGKRKRCYHCKAPNPWGGNGRPRSIVVTPEPEATDPVADHFRGAPEMVEVGGNGDPVLDVADHFLRSQEMVPPDPIAALRRVVDALDGLDADAVRWVLRSAARLPRPDHREAT